MNQKVIALVSLALVLASCGGTPTSSREASSSETISESSKEVASSSAVSIEPSVEDSSESSLLPSSEAKSSETVVESDEKSSETVVDSNEESSEEPSSEDILSSSEISSYRPTPGDSTWTLDYNAIPATSSGAYNIDFDFSVTSLNGAVQGFHGSYLQRGNGSKEGVSLNNTIQIKKGDGYFYTTTASCVFLRIITLKTGDYTGVPTLYSSNDLTRKGGTEISLEKTVLENQNKIQYEAMIPGGKFRLENNSSNVLYIVSMTNVG